ncbi:MAG: hypothetical protein JNL88_10705 [Bacteroidia bacterium]|nr:hypothetical protein [Bacteroidia bacterium]
MKKILSDHFLTGFIPGILLPLVGFYLYFLSFFGYMELDAFLTHVIRANLAVSVLSLGVIFNLAAFFLFYTKEMDKAARGVIGATFLYAFVVVYFKVLR